MEEERIKEEEREKERLKVEKELLEEEEKERKRIEETAQEEDAKNAKEVGESELQVRDEQERVEEQSRVKQQDTPGSDQHRSTFDNQPTTSEDGSGSGRAPVARSSSTGPTSPNPSFSSLQARPTPPATSGRSSPSASMLSSQAMTIPSASREDEDLHNDAFAASTSTSLTEHGGEVNNDSNADPLISSESQAQLSNVNAANQEQGREEPGFFPSALAHTSGSSSLGIDFAPAATRNKTANASSGDADSDGYGQPSPRDASHHPGQAPFAAGYGEVQYGLGSEGPSGQVEESDSLAKASSQSDGPSFTKMEEKKPIFQIRVGDPQKIGDPMTAHIVYTVRIKTDSSRFKANQFSVLRRYNDFRWLHAALVHNNPGIFIPPVPEKVKIGRFAPDLVEARRHGLESCINKIANNAMLQMDDDLKLFLESSQFQADVKMRDQIKGPVPTPEQKTYFGWSTSLTGTTYKYHESDEWFDEQRVYLDHLESQLKNLVRVVSTLAQQRKDIAGAISDFSHALMMLSGSSLSRSLSTCFAGLGEVQRRTFELADVQADADVRDFGSVIYEFERMVGSARKAFSTRIDAWQSWQKYEEESRKIRSKHEKLKKESQGNHRVHDGRMTSILDEIASIETKCLNQKREFDIIGRRCKEEMDRFEWDRIKSLEQACEVWLQGMIERNQEVSIVQTIQQRKC